MKYSIYLFVAMCLIVGCTKELPFPDAENDDFVVVNGLLNPESSPQVHLSQSCHLSDINCTQKVLTDAQVFLKDEAGNLLTELVHTSNGFYSSNDIEIENNKKYSIDASRTGMETISAKANVPKAFNSTLLSIDEKEYNDYVCRTFTIEIEDNPDESNYYLINGWVDILNGQHDEGAIEEVNGYILPHFGFLSRDLNAENTAMVSTFDVMQYPLEFVFLKDENFNGETYTLEFGLHDRDLFNERDYELEAHINVKSVSKELYEYYKSVTLYKLTSANILSEPIQILSNIENGIGIFGGYTEQQFVIDLPKTEFYFNTDFSVENEGCAAPCTIKFFGDLGDNVDFLWSFGDGTTSTEKNPEHVYSTSGTYNVTLTVFFGIDNITTNRDIIIN